MLILSAFDVSATEVTRLHQPQELQLIGKKITFLEDPTKILSISDILKVDNQQKFENNDKDVFTRPGTKSAFWFKIDFANETKEDAWLEIGSNYAWYIDFYAPDSAGQYHSPIETGTMRPDANKLYDVNYFWLPLNRANENEVKTYYIRVISGLTFELPLHIGTIRSLTKNKYKSDYIAAAFIGIILIMLIYNLFIYISTKDHIYLFYLGYLFIMAFSMPYANGYPFVEHINFWFIDKSFWNNYFLVWHTPAYYFVGTFCIRYLDLKNRAPKIRRLIQLEIAIIAGLFPLLNILGFQFVELVTPVQIAIMLLYFTCLITGYYFAFGGLKQAYFYSFGWTFLIIGASTFFAVINGYLPFNPITRNALYIGAAIEICLFALALANRMNVLQTEKDQIKSENLRLIQNQNEKLEREVNRRTSELEATNEELLQSNEELLLTTEQLDKQSRELKEVNQTKDRLFAIISHDLRSPINSLKGLLDLIYGENISKEEFLEFSVDAKHNVEHVHFMLNNLLNWARFQLQGITTKPETISLRQIISENIVLFKEHSKNKNISVINETAGDIAIFADYDQLNLVIRNLLSNALKFTEAGGQVKFNANMKSDFCEITISDNGIGMDKDAIKNLFNIRTDKVQVGTEGEKGTGLGLTLCKDFIEKNNGQIEIESEVGQGTTFTILLPIS